MLKAGEFPYDIHPEEVIEPTKFDFSTPSSFDGVKTDRQTDRIALYILDAIAEFKQLLHHIADLMISQSSVHIACQKLEAKIRQIFCPHDYALRWESHE